MRISGFEFSEGARFQPGAVQNADAVGQHLELLRKQCKGELTPQDVVNDARGHNSPLHSFFEWDDSAAAEAHRLGQARGLIRAVVAVYVSDDKPAIRQKAYVHIAEPQTPHYRELSHAMSQKRTRELVLQRAWRELQAWKNRYRDLKEFSALIDVIEEVEHKLPRKLAGN
jgi:hypothetical protein